MSEMSIRKRFDPSLYRENDPAKLEVLGYLQTAEHPYWEVNPDRYGPDLRVVWDDERVEYAEIEVKQHWQSKHGANFPYQTLQIPSRKEKWLGEWLKFWILSADRKYGIVVDTETISRVSTRQVVPNRYIRYGETFIIIPVSACEIIRLGPSEESI
jgi:hypothetical protein